MQALPHDSECSVCWGEVTAASKVDEEIRTNRLAGKISTHLQAGVYNLAAAADRLTETGYRIMVDSTGAGAAMLDETKVPLPAVCLLWIDRVGSVLLFTGERLTIGGPVIDAQSADLSLLANLSRQHCSLVRRGDRYLAYAHSAISVANRPVHDRCEVSDGQELALGSSVRIRFRQPNSMSATARLEFVSDHRPVLHVDSVVMMDETCLLGPGPENHVRCPDWSGSVLLYRRNGGLYCKSREELFINGQHSPAGGAVECGSVVSGATFRFRIESVLRVGLEPGAVAVDTGDKPAGDC